VIEQGPGQFLAEIGQLSGLRALVDGTAEGEVETLLIPPANLRSRGAWCRSLFIGLIILGIKRFKAA
jgi:hypothetical protein